MFAAEYTFQVESTIVTLLPKSTKKVAVELGVIAQKLGPHTCLLNTCAGLNLITIGFHKIELLLNVKKQQLSHLSTAIGEPILLDVTIMVLVVYTYQGNKGLSMV